MKFPVSRSEILLRRTQIFIIGFFSFIFGLFFLTSSVFAQTNPYATPNTNPDVPQNLHTWTQNVMIEVMAAATCQLAGVDPINPNQKCLGVDQKTNSIGFVEGGGGAIGLMGNLIALTYTPPLRTGDYFSYLAQNFGIAKPAYAQGTGFEGLKPLMNLWIAFRNIVYLLFVLVFVVIGVAIMLRVKIDPRTVMTIENQIPKIIVGIFLVTVSYAIAGFLIDLMWVSIYLLINIILGVNPKIAADISSIAQSTDPLMAANIAGGSGGNVGGLGMIVGTASDSISGIVSKLFDNPVGQVFIGFIGGIIGAVLGGKVSSAFDSIPLVGSIIGFVAGSITAAALATQLAGFVTKVIALLIIAIAILWALIRLWFELIKAYIFILLDVVLAPFFIVIGLFPGSLIGFGAWIRDIIANLAVFPVTIGMFLLGRVFIDVFGTTQTSKEFVPPLIGNPASTNAIGALIGLGIILMTPQIVTMMKEVLKAPQFKYGAAIGQAVGVGGGVFNLPGHVTKLGQLAYGLTALKGIKDFPVIGSIFGGSKSKAG